MKTNQAIPAGERFATAGADSAAVSVLIIDDDDATAEVYRTRLELDGYEVAAARDGHTGLELALTTAPDLIYLDLCLPGIDGFQVLQRLRGDPDGARIPVVILTNFDEPRIRQCGLQLGAVELLIKSATTPKALAAATAAWAAPRARVLRLQRIA